MQTITTIGLDIAKSVFQVHGVESGGCSAPAALARSVRGDTASDIGYRLDTRPKQSPNPLKSLARPTGLEPVLPP